VVFLPAITPHLQHDFTKVVRVFNSAVLISGYGALQI
jgi:hypothetical protein